MTVWTPVSLNEVNIWLKIRKLQAVVKISPIQEGVEDSVFKLDLEDNTSNFLRLFERTEPFGPLSIAFNLAQHGLPTCPPIKDNKGHFVLPLNGKPAAVFPWIDGAWVEKPSLEQIEAIGRFMGQMAREGVTHCKNWKRDNPRGWAWFEETTNKLLPVLPPNIAVQISNETEEQRSFWKNVDKQEIIHGPIHADLFRNNVIFDSNGKLAAVIDWGFCASDYPLIYDLAIVANDWCLKKNSHKLDSTKLKALMNARSKECPLTPAENQAWPMALRLAALRFYLSRQNDVSFPRNTDGKTLDPTHFYKILCAHKADAGMMNSCVRQDQNRKRPSYMVPDIA